MSASGEQLAEERYSPFLRVTARRWFKIYRGGAQGIWHFVDLLIRISIALTFLRSGLVKLANWDTALLLARAEYPVSWMEPGTAAIVGVTIELIPPVLLAIGLFTRPAALAMAVLIAVTQAVYIPTTTNLFLIALLGWYALYGPASISFDRLLGPGLKSSAVFFARQVIGFGESLRTNVAPMWMLAVRIWLALTLLAVAGVFEPSIAVATWLPIASFGNLSVFIAVILAVLLIVGLASVPTAIVLAVVVSALAAMGLHPDIIYYPILLFALYGLRGPGMLSLDNAIGRWFENNFLFDRNYADIPERWPHIVVVGAGFGGLAAVSRLKSLPVRITLIDRRNYHLFQPLLYQIATATLSPADIATPIRSLFRDDGNVRVLKGEVQRIDSDKQTVHFGDGHEMEYDRLVLATGASHSYFGKDEWSEFAPGLKTVEDGVSVRASILNAFEDAETCNDDEQIRRLLNFVIVGGGPTGVELAGAIAELARQNVEREFRTFDPATARVVLVQSGPRILPAFPEDLALKASKSLEALGVEIRTGGRVTEIANNHVMIGEDTRIDTETVLWAAGVVASPAAKWVEGEADRSGRLVVDDYLLVPGHENVFAIGDTALSQAWDGKPVPGLAPAAKQAGTYVAKMVEADLLGKAKPKPFSYKHQGSLATIGRKSAVADFGTFKMSGALAWWMWGFVHIGFLTGLRNRASVAVNWLWSFFARHSGVRLITGRDSGA